MFAVQVRRSAGGARRLVVSLSSATDMNILRLIVAVAAMLFTGFSTLTMWVFSAAALANASEASIQRVKHWVIGCSSCSFVCIAAGIWLLRAKRPGWAAGVAIFPAIVMGGIFAWKIIS